MNKIKENKIKENKIKEIKEINKCIYVDDIKEYFKNNNIIYESIKNGVKVYVGSKINDEIDLNLLNLQSLKFKDKFVIKEVNIDNFNINEIMFLEIAKNKNFEYSYEYYGCLYNNNYVYIIIEYIDGDSLNKYLPSIKQNYKITKDLDIINCIRIIIYLAKAIKELHDNNIIHNDIKPDNIMVNNGKYTNYFKIKLIDYGMSCNLNIDIDKQKNCDTTLGTSLYNLDLNFKNINMLKNKDWYSFGKVLSDIFGYNIIQYEKKYPILYNLLIFIYNFNEDIDKIKTVTDDESINSSDIEMSILNYLENYKSYLDEQLVEKKKYDPNRYKKLNPVTPTVTPIVTTEVIPKKKKGLLSMFRWKKKGGYRKTKKNNNRKNKSKKIKLKK